MNATRNTLAWWTLLLAGVAFACGSCDSAEDETLHDGLVSFGFEVSAFEPCDSGVRWWITGSNTAYTELLDAYHSLGIPNYTRAFARLRGNPSTKKGSYGHLGAYEREFEVTEVVEVRLHKPGECDLSEDTPEHSESELPLR
jgi:hypothetical protein